MSGHAVAHCRNNWVGWAELGGAQRIGLRLVLPEYAGLPAEAGSRPGGRLTFWQQHQKVSKECRPASTPRLRRGALRCSRRRGPAELALALLGARTVLGPAVLRTSEPGNAALLGVSEGDRKASTFDGRWVIATRTQAEGWNPAAAVGRLAVASDSAPLHPDYDQPTRVDHRMVLTLGPVESAEWRSEVGGSARRADGEDCLSGGRSPARVPQPPDFASTRGKSGTQCLTANAGCPSLWFLSLGQARERNPAAGTDSRPKHAPKSTTPIASNKARPPDQALDFVPPRATDSFCVEMLGSKSTIKP